jgi:Tfp pilus assembly protein PilN
MSGPVFTPEVNFSRDVRPLSLVLSLVLAGLAAAALFETGILLWEGAGYWVERSRTLKQADELGAELATLLSQHRDEPDPVAIRSLRQRIASLNALDYAGAPSPVRVFSTLEQLMPPSVALQNLDYDRGRSALELVAFSESSDELTAFFDLANRNTFFPSVRLVDKKQAGTTATGAPVYQVRLSIRFGGGEPRS